MKIATGIPRLLLLALLLLASLCEARISSQLKGTPITLGLYDPSQSKAAKLSPNGSLFGQIDKSGNVNIWLTKKPALPALSIKSDDSKGQYYSDVFFSEDNRYIILDSKIANTSIATKGQLVVISADTFKKKRYNTNIWGGSYRSKFALSSTGILAYVPVSKTNQIKLVDLNSKVEHQIFDNGLCPIIALAFDESSAKIAIKDQCGKNIRIRDSKTGELLNQIELQLPMPDDGYSPQQSIFFWGENQMLAVNSDVYSMAYALDARTGAGQFPIVWFEPLAMFLNNYKNILAIADENFCLNIQKTNDPTLYTIQPFGYDNFVLSGAFSPDDKILAVGSSNGQIAIYDSKLNFLNSGSLLQALQIMQIAFINNNKFISLSEANTLELWELLDE